MGTREGRGGVQQADRTQERRGDKYENARTELYEICGTLKRVGASRRARVHEWCNNGVACRGIDCQEFKLLNANNETAALWEERLYPAAEWTETYVDGVDFNKAMGEGFNRLFQYISGANEAKAKIAMTAPVLNYITPGAGPFCEDHFNISFFVPFDFQGKAPAPTSPDVYSVTHEPMKVYVTSFGGYADVDKLRSAAATLAGNLATYNVDFDQEHFYYAGYDSPFRVLDRHNEVWYVSK